MEDYAFILDYLPHGHHEERRFKREPIAFGLGENEFKLLELTPKPNVTLQIGDRVYIGKDLELRREILHVKRRINHKDLTSTAQCEMPYIISDIIKRNKERFVKFYNEAHPISTRFHMLELLPGLGKKTMLTIVNVRKKSPFVSFEDLKERMPSLRHPEELIRRRIELELTDPSQKYRLFVGR